MIITLCVRLKGRLKKVYGNNEEDGECIKNGRGGGKGEGERGSKYGVGEGDKKTGLID